MATEYLITCPEDQEVKASPGHRSTKGCSNLLWSSKCLLPNSQDTVVKAWKNDCCLPKLQGKEAGMGRQEEGRTEAEGWRLGNSV